MSDRRKKQGRISKWFAYTFAAVFHIALIAALFVNFTTKREDIEAFDADKIDLVKAQAIDEAAIKKQQKKLEEQDRKRKLEKQREKERLEKLKKEADKKKQELDDLKKKKEKEKAEAERLEEERKAIALKKKKEEEERKKKEAAEKRKKEQERKKREKAAKEKAERERKAREQEERELQQMLQEEERMRQAQEADRIAKQRTTTVLAKYSSLIKRAVNQRLRRPDNVEPWRKVELNIKLSPRGEVQSVRVVKSSGIVAFDRAVETAVLQASPLPLPTPEEDQSAHNQLRDLLFSVPD